MPTSFTPAREAAYDFHLHDQNGRPASLADERGKVIALTWIYTSCRDLCPAEGVVIADALRKVGGDRAVGYAVSVDPVGDTPARARDWLERRHFDAGDGRYLLGTRAKLRPVWLHYGIVPINATPAEAQRGREGGGRLPRGRAARHAGASQYRRRPRGRRRPRPARSIRTPTTWSTAAAYGTSPAGTTSTRPTSC